VPFDRRQLRLERVKLDTAYHAAYSFYGLKGAIAERWAHGPIFGAVGEVGSGQLNLTPASEEGADERILGIAGIRASVLIAEGKRWTSEASLIGLQWFEDIYTVLKPQRTVSLSAEFFGIYPVRDPVQVSQRLRLRYYQDDPLTELVGAERFHAAVEVFASDENPMRTIIVGVVGPPHRGQYFTFDNPRREARWWLGARLIYAEASEDGIAEPLEKLSRAAEAAQSDWERLSRTVFPPLIR
jgi:hypothetical protein